MPLTTIVAIAIGLAMDALAVSLAAGAGAHMHSPRPALRFAFHLGLFQFMMPVIGWFLGVRAGPLIESVDHWLAFGLLAFVGGRMVRSGLDPEPQRFVVDPSRGLALVTLSLACSIDALAVGMSLAVLQVDILYPSVIIGLVTAGLSILGILVGNRVGSRFGKRTELAGGVLLILIGLMILEEHLFG